VVDVSLCQNPGCTQKRIEVVLQGTEKAAEDANAAAIGRPQAGVSNSQTPLVNRNNAQLVPNSVAGTGQTGQVAVPDVTGTTPEQARVRLTSVGLVVAPQVSYVPGAKLPPAQRGIGVGRVVATSPAAGATASPGTSVVLTVRRN